MCNILIRVQTLPTLMSLIVIHTSHSQESRVRKQNQTTQKCGAPDHTTLYPYVCFFLYLLKSDIWLGDYGNNTIFGHSQLLGLLYRHKMSISAKLYHIC